MSRVARYRSAEHPTARPGRWVRRALFGVLLVLLLVVGGTGFRVWQVARADERRPVDIAIVLGAAQYHGEPSDVLEARLDHALELYQDGLVDHVVTVGGRQRGDEFTEAQAGKEWLVEHGVPEGNVVPVDVGSDTIGSVRAVDRLADRRGWETALIVSDPWHSLRARTMANDAGLTTWASPTRSGPMVQTREIQFNYILRETAGLLFYRLTHAPAEVSGFGLG